MADVDILPSRGIRAAALVDGNGVAINGTQTVLQLAQRGMRSICEVTPLGVAANGATLLQLAQRGIRNFCPVSELGVATDSSTAATLRQRGIQPMVPVSATGVALTGSATILTLAQRGLTHFCPLNESGAATTLIDPTPLNLHALTGDFRLSGETMEPIAGWTVTAQAGAFSVPANSATNLVPPTAAYTGPGEVTGWDTAYGYWGLRAYNTSKIGANCIDVCSNVNGAAVNLTTVVIGSDGYANLTPIGFSPIYVNRIYDQSGAQDLFFNSGFERPQISTTTTVGGKPSMRFNGSCWGMSTSNATALAQTVNVAIVFRAMTYSSNGRILTDGSVNFMPFIVTAAATVSQYLGVFPDPHTIFADNTFGTLVSVCANSAGGVYVNGGTMQAATGNVGPNGIGTTNKLTMGGTDDGGQLINGYIYEILIKGGSISAGNVGLLNTNQHTIGTGW
jgi:hypothetical protein